MYMCVCIIILCVYACVCTCVCVCVVCSTNEDKDWKLLEELLGGVCTYFRIAGSNGRSRLCSLGMPIQVVLMP